MTNPFAVRLEVRVTLPLTLKFMAFQVMPLVLSVQLPVILSVEEVVVIVPDE